MSNAALRTATGCTQNTNIQHVHDETLTLPIHTTCSSTPLNSNKIKRAPTPHIIIHEEIAPRLSRRTLAQLRTNKSPFLKSYLHKVDAKSHPSPLCVLCNTYTHNTHDLFAFTHIYTIVPGFVAIYRRRDGPGGQMDGPAGQMDGKYGWWTTNGKSGTPQVAREKRVGRQQQCNFQLAT